MSGRFLFLLSLLCTGAASVAAAVFHIDGFDAALVVLFATIGGVFFGEAMTRMDREHERRRSRQGRVIDIPPLQQIDRR
jgi:hypothetical protein